MCVPDEERESSWKIRVKTFLIKIIPRKAIQRTFSCTFKCCPLFPSTNTNDNNIKLYSCTLSTINIQIGDPLLLVLFFHCFSESTTSGGRSTQFWLDLHATTNWWQTFRTELCPVARRGSFFISSDEPLLNHCQSFHPWQKAMTTKERWQANFP